VSLEQRLRVPYRCKTWRQGTRIAYGSLRTLSGPVKMFAPHNPEAAMRPVGHAPLPAASVHRAPPPLLLLNPSSDYGFRQLVHSVMGMVDDPAALQTMLRLRYPLAVVRARELSGERYKSWYVYRDGRWTDSLAPRDE
jgi:hypothetical protein